MIARRAAARIQRHIATTGEQHPIDRNHGIHTPRQAQRDIAAAANTPFMQLRGQVRTAQVQGLRVQPPALLLEQQQLRIIPA